MQKATLDFPTINVYRLWDEPEECNMCDSVGFHTHAVPWYCGPVQEGKSEGGYKVVCKPCHDKWELWNTSLRED